MPGKSRRIALAASVDTFEADVRQLAIALARNVIEAEFVRVLAVSEKVKPRKRRRVARAAVEKSTATSATEQSPMAVEAESLPAEWTRDSVIAELGRWLTSKDVDPAFLKRHGPRGLVGAAKRIFGRFDAALNAANLAIAPRMRDTRQGPSPSQAWPSMRELARRQRA